MSSTLVIHAHPQAKQSVVIHGIRQVLATQEEVQVRSLYELYPDFDIDVAAEQQALAAADLVIWLTPVHWYSVPALMKHWFDEVLTHGWAYGQGAQALAGKPVWWITSTGGDARSYAPDGEHQRPFSEYVVPIEQVARYCAMRWLAPFAVHGGHNADAETRMAAQKKLLQTLASHQQSAVASGSAA